MTLSSHQSARLLDRLVEIRKVASSVSIRRECSTALVRIAKLHETVGRDWVTWLPHVIDELVHESADATQFAKFQKHLPELFSNCWDVRAMPIHVAEEVANRLESTRDVLITVPLLALLVECLGPHANVLFAKSRARQSLHFALVSDKEASAAAWVLWRRVLLQATSLPHLLAAPFTLILDLRPPDHIWPLATQTFRDFWLSLTAIDNALFSNFQDVLLEWMQRAETAVDARALLHHCCVVQLAPDHLEVFHGFWLKAVFVLCRQAAGGLTDRAGAIMEWLMGQLSTYLRTSKNSLGKTRLLAEWIRVSMDCMGCP